MMCELCAENIASVHVTRIVNGNKSEINVCAACAVRLREIMPLPLNQLFAGIMEESQAQRQRRPLRRCETCGLTYEQFRESGRLGCSHCYEVFREDLLPILQRVHGSVEYRGHLSHRMQAQFNASQKQQAAPADPLAELKENMRLAVEREDFEEAARLRDEIRQREGALPEGREA